MLQPIDVSHIFVADKHEEPQRRQSKNDKDNVVVQVEQIHMIISSQKLFLRAATGFAQLSNQAMRC